MKKTIILFTVSLLAFVFASCGKATPAQGESEEQGSSESTGGSSNVFGSSIPTGIDFMDDDMHLRLNGEVSGFISDWVYAYNAAEAGESIKGYSFQSGMGSACLSKGYSSSLTINYDFDGDYNSFKINDKNHLIVSTVYASTSKPADLLMMNVSNIYDSGNTDGAKKYSQSKFKSLYFGKKNTKTIPVSYTVEEDSGCCTLAMKKSSGDKFGNIYYFTATKKWVVEIASENLK